jgi:uracil phosphoribosyltransferase
MDGKVTLLNKENSYLNHILQELRDEVLQQDRLRFRNNLEKIGEILAYEVSKSLNYSPQEVTTPLGKLNINLLTDQPVIVSILRAGIPLHNGFLRMFDKADNGFIAAYRYHTRGNDFIVKVEYRAMPSIGGRDLIIVDPMIATGKSLELSYQQLLEYGEPANVYIVGVIASEEGLEYIQRKIPQARIYVAAIDNELTAKGYIVPGLGDAGDLAFGPK